MTDDNSAILDMDETREIRWTFKAIKEFESRARTILKRQDIKVPHVVLINGVPTEVGQPRPAIEGPTPAGHIMAKFIKIADILEAAVAATTALSGLEGKDGPSPAAKAIQGYLDRGGNIIDLENTIYRAYRGYEGPSSLAEYESNLAREAEMKHLEAEKREAELEIQRIDLAEKRAKVERLRKASGSAPTASPT